MHPRIPLVALAALLLVGCDKDTDEDGLTDAEEEEFGSDIEKPDTDGDGLTDLEEYDLGTDPTLEDTDEDTYSDFDEVNESTDPTDPDDRIYTGYWPYNPDKDSVSEGEWTACMDWNGCNREGEQLPRFQWVDQYGEAVDIFDFAQQGKYIIMDVSGYWCGYCTEMALWLEGESDYYHSYPSYGLIEEYEQIRDMVNAGDVYWVTILDSWSGSAPATEEDPAWWYDYYPHDLIPVLADTDWNMNGHFGIVGYPFVALLDENMTVVVGDGDYTRVWDEILAEYPDWTASE